MKVALCLYGQPRDAHVKFEHVYQNVIEPNKCDVFFHAWYDQENLSMNKLTPGHESRSILQGMDQYIISAYNPKDHKIEKQLKFHHRNFEITQENFDAVYPWSEKYDRDQFIKDRGACTHSMWYSVSQSILLKELYSHRQGFKYDCVFLSRFDVSPTKKIFAEEYDVTKIVTRSQTYPRGEVCDWFLFTNNDNINVVGNTFNLLDTFHSKIQKSSSRIWNNESFLRESLSVHELQVMQGDFDVTF